MLDISAIYNSVKAGDDDAALDGLILQYLIDQGISLTVEEWRVDNYALLRKWAYPDPVEIGDAESKENSSDPRLIASGHIQKAKYYADCLVVKDRFQPPYQPIDDFSKLKEHLIEIVNAARQLKMYAGFLVDGVLFAFDDRARLAYQELALALSTNPSYSTDWRTVNEWVVMDMALFQKTLTAATVHVQTCFNWQKSKEAELNACMTVSELNSVILT